MTTKAENFIHIRFEHDSAIECKRDILSTEIDLLRMKKRLQRYIDSRMEEIEIKTALDKKLRSLKLDLGRLQNLMPGVKIPKLLKSSGKKEEEDIEDEFSTKKMKPSLKDILKESDESEEVSDLDKELQSIQEKLNSLA